METAGQLLLFVHFFESSSVFRERNGKGGVTGIGTFFFYSFGKGFGRCRGFGESVIDLDPSFSGD